MKGATTLYLVRHGETELNRRDCFRGASPAKLNELGRRQAEEVGRALADLEPAAVLSSPMERAWETARALAAPHGLEPRAEAALRNIDLGAWNGRPKAEVQREEPARWRLWLERPEDLRVPGAETLSQVRRRAWAGIVALEEEFRGRTLLVVSHSTVLRPILAAALDLPPPWLWRFHLDHASYSILVRRPHRDWCLVALNRTHHLSRFVSENA